MTQLVRDRYIHRAPRWRGGDRDGLSTHPAGWCLGDEAFKKELLGQMGDRAGENHYAQERQESGEEQARRIVAVELKRLGWKPVELERRRKGDPKKVQIARRLRTETAMTLKWIATELQMGAWTHVSNLLSRSKASR